MGVPTCDSCNQEMELEKRLKDGKNIKGQKYRRRRYYCYLCKIHHTMYCEGSGDKEATRQAVIEAKKMF